MVDGCSLTVDSRYGDGGKRTEKRPFNVVIASEAKPARTMSGWSARLELSGVGLAISHIEPPCKIDFPYSFPFRRSLRRYAPSKDVIANTALQAQSV